MSGKGEKGKEKRIEKEDIGVKVWLKGDKGGKEGKEGKEGKNGKGGKRERKNR